MNSIPVRPFVLFADDDEMNRLLLCEAVEQSGFHPVAVEDGTKALHEALSGRYDIILLDVEMPGLDGYAVCRALRATPGLKHLPVVMITGNDSAEFVEQAFEAGATDFISKPINWAVLPHRLRYIVRNAQADQRTRDLAYRDELTGLQTRQALLERITESLAQRSVDEGADSIAVLQLDIDAFDRIEALGPDVSEAAIRGVSGALSYCLHRFAAHEPRASFEIAHLESDRFALSIRSPAAGTLAVRFAEQVAESFEEPVLCGDHRFFLKPVMGLALHPQHGTGAATLLLNAEAARHEAQVTGSATLVHYHEDMRVKTAERLALDAELRRAVRNDELVLHYQPKIHLADGSLAGVEALLRWHHPTRGAISPAVFVPIAEESDLILEIGRWVIQAAARQLRAWNDLGFHTTIAVNVSGRQFLHRDPAADIASAARTHGIETGQLMIEITESMLMLDLKTVADGLAAVRALGCRVAIDDFGTGYSSLAYLKGLPIDEIKIDRRFVELVDCDDTDSILCSTILQLGSRLGLTMTAEGIETPGQLAWLKDHGCDEAQGFLLARPMPAQDLVRRYAEPVVVPAQVA